MVGVTNPLQSRTIRLRQTFRLAIWKENLLVNSMACAVLLMCFQKNENCIDSVTFAAATLVLSHGRAQLYQCTSKARLSKGKSHAEAVESGFVVALSGCAMELRPGVPQSVKNRSGMPAGHNIHRKIKKANDPKCCE